MRKKTAEMGPRREVAYGPEAWERLRGLRERASGVLALLGERDVEGRVFGSVARGDVKPGSDVDIFIPEQASLVRIGLALDDLVLERSIVQATPRALVKAHVVLEDGTNVLFPLIPPREMELEFYRFGGEIGAKGIAENRRVCGVDKRLMLVEPTPEGHVETPLSDLPPGWPARRIGVSQAIVEERIRVLGRRAVVGRTGVYLHRVLAPEESFGQVLAELAYGDPAMRRRMSV